MKIPVIEGSKEEKEQIFTRGVVCGFGISLILLFLFGLIWIGISENSKPIIPDTFQKGMFGINDIYNTCLYFSQEQGLMFDGYCYKELPSKDRALESCITGCKLGVPFNEDENVCFDRCQKYLINKE